MDNNIDKIGNNNHSNPAPHTTTANIEGNLIFQRNASIFDNDGLSIYKKGENGLEFNEKLLDKNSFVEELLAYMDNSISKEDAERLFDLISNNDGMDEYELQLFAGIADSFDETHKNRNILYKEGINAFIEILRDIDNIEEHEPNSNGWHEWRTGSNSVLYKDGDMQMAHTSFDGEWDPWMDVFSNSSSSVTETNLEERTETVNNDGL